MMLTDEQIVYIAASHDAVNADDSFWKEFARAIEAKARDEQAGEIARLREETKQHEINYALERDDNRELREANAELIEGLKRYNRHLMHCDRLDYHDAGKGECTCGLEELIAKHGGKE